ncbi:DUF3293 domain-containing protein [Roseateles violae]|uniref:DUF3293 domain-containing protein n=1 Tax=Roseateles violae TaxID=3058042 RepID=A0ABT8DPU5_9BURK|nr:DUF3293 domain-containing protein [Pelomonas sp. PFR6]MDN3919108.1 DUF3293 domain-containing protein [Pelomonas sp. PFR6]
MTVEQQIPRPAAALRQSYEATLFEVLEAAPAVFRIGDGGTCIDAWLASVGARSACIITAWNPFSASTLPEQNHARQQRLLASIEAASLRWLPAQGRDPSGEWPPEPSLCVLDMDEHQIDAWLQEFEQYAAVVLIHFEGCHLRWHPGVTL